MTPLYCRTTAAGIGLFSFFSSLRALYIIDALPEHRERLIDQLKTVFLPAMRT